MIEQEIKLNHPERADGQLRAWVDGRLVYGYRIRQYHKPLRQTPAN